jgi:4'-phosphopantetheinyl transferase
VTGVILHCIDLTLCPTLERCAEALDQSEQDRLALLATPDLRRRFAARRWALRRLLAVARGTAVEDIRLLADARGRLRFNDGAGPWFSAAHRGDRAVIAWSQREVGVDLEVPASLSGSPPIALMAIEEQTWFADQQDADSFLRLWTAKEAYLKARGVGLGEDLTASAVIPDEQGAQIKRTADGDLEWTIVRLADPATVVSVCHRPGEALAVADEALTRGILAGSA